MPPDRPSWFRWQDLLFFGGPALISLGCTLLVFNVELDQKISGPFGAHGLMTVVTLAFTGIYARLVWLRYKTLSEFRYVRGPYYSVMIHPGRFALPDDAEIIGQFYKAFDGWSRAFMREDIRAFADNALFWVWMKSQMERNLRSAGTKVAGYTVANTRKMVVRYQNSKEPLEKTALQHEIGHILQGELTGSWMESEHHERARQYSLR